MFATFFLKKFYLIHLSKVIICYTALWMNYKSYEFRYVSDFFVLNTYCKYCKLIWNISSMFTLRYKHIWLQRCVYTHTLSICGIYSKPFTVWAAHLSRPACQPVTQSAKDLPNLPTAQDCPGPYRPKLLHRDSGFNSLGANTGTHIFAIVA